jgi:putative membrane protein
MLLSLASKGLVLLAETSDEVFFSVQFLRGLFGSVVFGLVGIALVVLGFKIFDWALPKIDVERELAEKHNMPVAIVAAAVILGICYIIANVVH